MNNRRRFSEEYKRSAVEMVVSEGMLQSDVCSSLGIARSTLSKWIKLFKKPEESKGISIAELNQRVKALESENRLLKMEREILKKATTFFAKETS